MAHSDIYRIYIYIYNDGCHTINSNRLIINEVFANSFLMIQFIEDSLSECRKHNCSCDMIDCGLQVVNGRLYIFEKNTIEWCFCLCEMSRIVACWTISFDDMKINDAERNQQEDIIFFLFFHIFIFRFLHFFEHQSFLIGASSVNICQNVYIIEIFPVCECVSVCRESIT